MRPLINSLRLFKANANEQREALNNNTILIINNDKKITTMFGENLFDFFVQRVSSALCVIGIIKVIYWCTE